jgi:PAT family beta-lactamase induction signal transducer AmpG
VKKSYKNLAVIFFLGIASGMPLALILSTLKAFLLEQGFDLATIGFFSLAALPYSLKIFFAPIIDSKRIPLLTKAFGQRKSWIILTQILLAVFIATLGVGGIFSNLSAIASLAFLIGLASASQDIVIDGYRIELIEKENQGFAASFYVYGYRIGLLISGAAALVLAEVFGWNAVYFILAAVMTSCALVTIFIEETRKNFKQKNENFREWFGNFIIDPLRDLTKHKLWFVILLFVVFFKLGDSFAGNLTLPFLLEIGFSKIEIAKIVKTFGLFATLAGALCGGILVKKINLINTLWIAAILQMVSNLAFAFQAKLGYDPGFLYFTILAENFSGGIGDAAFVAYLSSLCNLSFSATQYAVLSSLATVARSFLASSAGVFAQRMGWYNFFILSTFLALPGIIFLFWLTIKNNRKNYSN